MIDSFVRTTIEDQYERAKGMILKHRDKLDMLAKILLVEETMSVTEFLEVFEGKEKAIERAKADEERKALEAAEDAEVSTEETADEDSVV